MNRRSFLFGATAVCAPAIIRPGILMPVKQMLAIGDGVALISMAHPVARGEIVADLTEQSLIAMMQEIRFLHSIRPRFIHFQ